MNQFLDWAGLQKYTALLKKNFAAISHAHSNVTAATSSVAGKAGIVPAPAAGAQNYPLCGDATFKVLPIGGGGLVLQPQQLLELI